jgi:hypothetical protein
VAAINEDELRRRINRHGLFNVDVDEASLALVLALVAASDELVNQQGLTRGDVEAKLSTHLCWLYDLAWETVKPGLPKRGKVSISHRRER